MKYQIKHIPEYDPHDSLADRLSALVRLEQFLDERTVTLNIIKDLESIIQVAEKSQESNEKRVSTIATLILNQYQRCFSDNNKKIITLSSIEFQYLQNLKRLAKTINLNNQVCVHNFLTTLKKATKACPHEIIEAYAYSLLKSYEQKKNFSNVFDYKIKSSR